MFSTLKEIALQKKWSYYMLNKCFKNQTIQQHQQQQQQQQLHITAENL